MRASRSGNLGGLACTGAALPIATDQRDANTRGSHAMIRHAKTLAVPLVALQLAGCAMFLPHDNTLSCTIPVAVYPDDARPIDREVTVLVRALITASGEPENVTITTSSRNAAADRAAVAAMSRARCTQKAAYGGKPSPFTLTQPFVFEPGVGQPK